MPAVISVSHSQRSWTLKEGRSTRKSYRAVACDGVRCLKAALSGAGFTAVAAISNHIKKARGELSSKFFVTSVSSLANIKTLERIADGGN